MNQLVKDSSNARAPMDLNALKEVDKEGHSSGGDGAKSDSVEESEHIDDGNGLTVYGSHGCLYNLARRGTGKSSGQGDSGKGTTFNGHCSWCGRYGHTAHFQSRGGPIQRKVKGKSNSGIGGFSARTMSRAGFK